VDVDAFFFPLSQDRAAGRFPIREEGKMESLLIGDKAFSPPTREQSSATPRAPPPLETGDLLRFISSFFGLRSRTVPLFPPRRPLPTCNFVGGHRSFSFSPSPYRKLPGTLPFPSWVPSLERPAHQWTRRLNEAPRVGFPFPRSLGVFSVAEKG